jgi:hypothetical protein
MGVSCLGTTALNVTRLTKLEKREDISKGIDMAGGAITR